MKKIKILFCVLIVAIMLCLGIISGSGKSNLLAIFNKLLSISSKNIASLPQRYTGEMALQNGDVVEVNGKYYNLGKLEKFVENYKNKNTTTDNIIRITKYTNEGDAVINELSINGNAIRLIEDNTRDRFSSESDRIRKEYKAVSVNSQNDNGNQIYSAKLDDGTEKPLLFLTNNKN